MYTNIPFWLSLVFILGGLVALAWSSDAFVDGAAAFARRLGISPFIVGMVIIGFGTCAPEFCVSVFSGVSGHSDLSLGNAYGSCVFNVAAVLGIAAMVCPLVVKPTLTFAGAPLMTGVAAASAFVLKDNFLSRTEGLALLGGFAILFPLYCWFDQRQGAAAKEETSAEVDEANQSTARMLFNLVVGLVVMIGASHLLVWGSVDLARTMGVDELLIGLTVVAIGTSVPELATAVQSARKGESELVLGNIVGSNIFNTMVVVGTAGALTPTGSFSHYVLWRDIPVLIAISVTVFLFGINWRKPRQQGTITALEGFIWVVLWLAYTGVMIYQEVYT